MTSVRTGAPRRARSARLRRRAIRRRRLLVAITVLFAITAATAGSLVSVGAARPSSPATKADRPQTRIVGVGSRVAVYVDRSRSTFDYLTGVSVPDRRIVTEIRYPSWKATATEVARAPVLRRAGPYPVIVFAEGYRARPDLYAKLLDAWVRAGYVVISPLFPDTTYPETDPAIDAGYPHGSPEDDLVNEPQDIAFVLGQLRHTVARSSSYLHGLLNLREVLLAGQSDGAAVVDAYAFDARYTLNRAPIRAVAVFAGYVIGNDATKYQEPSVHPIPALVAQSASDTCNEPDLSVALYNGISGEKFFLKIFGATHLGPFDGTDPLAFDAVRNMTLRFFAHALTPSRISSPAVIKAGTLASIATASDAPSIAPIATPAGSPYCAPAY